MNNRQNRSIPELEIPDYKKYIDWGDENEDVERLIIPANVLIDLIQHDPAVEEDVAERFLTYGYKDEDKTRDLMEDLDIREQPEVWKMNACDFKRYLCEILELNYHTSQREILVAIGEKMEGLR